MQVISLNGDWLLNQVGEKTYFASVPGCVHTDLLNAGKIDEPFYRDNEKKLMWIGETDWDYSRKFYIDEDLLQYDKVLLKCNGLDTLATVSINDRKIGYCNNMYRTWEFDIKPSLKKGENTINVFFHAPMPYLRTKEKEWYLPAWSVGDHRLNSGSWIRKQPSNFGWDWGPQMVTVGIWKDIEINAFNKARIDNVNILQDHSESDVVNLTINTEIESFKNSDLSLGIIIEDDEEVLQEKKIDSKTTNIDTETANNVFNGQLNINNPRLWWPNGMGKQPLYNIKVSLYDTEGNVLDTVMKRIGLRTLDLVLKDDQWGQSFEFAVNGVSFFAKGANWIPADTFVSRLKYEDYYDLLASASRANMNMIRVWGGGIYEDDSFYEICDELGICVWQDFMFACSTYPTFDDDFMENVRVEAEQNVKRIRHHASLALWCGNNEIEQGIAADEWDVDNTKMSWKDYKKLFDNLLPGIVEELSPQVDYWPGSPHSPKGDREDHANPKWGDVHLWDVWHGKKPFEWYRTCEHRFNSEFGFQSFPEPKTVNTYTEAEDRNITSYIMEEHQRSGIGNTTIMQYMLDWFRLPVGFENVLWTSQILQGLGIKYAVENWRRGMPQGMGTLYWQLNDCWPVASWSSIDYYGRWKALHYMARKFYAPLLISGIEDNDTNSVELHVTSDKINDLQGEVLWNLTDVDGNKVVDGSLDVDIPKQQNNKITTLDLSQYVEEYGIRNLMIWVELRVDGEIVSDNFISFAKPKHMELQKSEISYELNKLEDKRYEIAFSSDRPVLWTWLEIKNFDAKISDNFFHLYPGKEIFVSIEFDDKMSEDELKEILIVRSLIDTYR